MFGTHMTMDGQELRIEDMTPDHLLNYIHLKIRQMQNIKQQVGRPAGSEWQRALSEREEVSVEEAARKVRKILRDLYPYAVRAWILKLECPQELTDVLYAEVRPLRQLVSGETSVHF